jgi:hypothetical protein
MARMRSSLSRPRPKADSSSCDGWADIFSIVVLQRPTMLFGRQQYLVPSRIRSVREMFRAQSINPRPSSRSRCSTRDLASSTESRALSTPLYQFRNRAARAPERERAVNSTVPGNSRKREFETEITGTRARTVRKGMFWPPIIEIIERAEIDANPCGNSGKRETPGGASSRRFLLTRGEPRVRSPT